MAWSTWSRTCPRHRAPACGAWPAAPTNPAPTSPASPPGGGTIGVAPAAAP
jgi:hypothetical protein